VKVNTAYITSKRIKEIKIPGLILNNVFNIIVKGSVMLFHHDNNPRNLNGRHMINIE
jgi:hypothetical protein